MMTAEQGTLPQKCSDSGHPVTLNDLLQDGQGGRKCLEQLIRVFQSNAETHQRSLNAVLCSLVELCQHIDRYIPSQQVHIPIQALCNVPESQMARRA